jgi:hypothetical protein
MIKIAVDFDGTIVEHRYPAIGETKLFAFETLKEFQNRGFLLVLWTFRTGRELDEAVEFCRNNGVEFYAINKSYPEEVFDESSSRKIDADIFIDDRNLGGFPGWSEVWQVMFPESMLVELEKNALKKMRKPSLLSRIFKKKDNI